MIGLIGGRSCRTCEHRFVQSQVILCLRYPPTLLLVPMKQPNGEIQPGAQSFYPQVNPDMPCGEYRRNEEYAALEIAAQTQGMARQ